MALTLKSQRQIQTDILNAIISRIGLTDVNPGSVLDVLTQSMAQEDFNQYVQMSQIVRLVDLESTTGEDLANRAFEYGLTRNPAISATGQVNIIRNNYTKISTTFVSSGVLAPSEGDGTALDKPLLINDASMFLKPGTLEVKGTQAVTPMLVIGRGTDVEEIVELAFDAPGSVVGTGNSVQPNTGDVNTATFYRVYLRAGKPLLFNHSFTDEIVFVPPVPENGSSNVQIAAGTIVAAPATGTSDAINFEVTAATTLFSGEQTLSNVDVRAIEVGANGNVGVGQISTIDLEGLGVTNVSAFSTGSDIELDDSLRDRIRSSIQSLSRGTRQAILNAIVGVVDPESSKRVVSANVILPQSLSEAVKVFIDDGTGFEPTFLPQAFETVVEDATGTTRLQLDFAPLVKAQIESALSEPYDLSAATTTQGGLNLEVRVGTNNNDNITFTTEDLSFPATTRAEEITRIINNKATFIEARTSADGTKVVISAKADTNEDIFVSGGTVNQFIQFTNTDQSTLYLYKNDKLLSKDGSTGFVQTFTETNSGTNTGIYAFASTPGSNLSVQVDGKVTATGMPALQTVNFVNTRTVEQTIMDINNQLSGATASLASDGRNIRIISNTELSSSSRVQIYAQTSGNDANDILKFVESSQVGVNSDYTLNRELGTIELGIALEDGDVVTAGNEFSRGAIRTSVPVSNSSTIQSGTSFTVTVDATFNMDGTINESVSRTVTFDERFTGTFLTSTTSVDSKPDALYGFNRVSVQSGSQDLATFIAAFINNTIYPFATAFVRTVSNSKFIEIRTNSYSSSRVSVTDGGGDATRNGNIRLIVDTPLQRGLWSNEPTVAVNNNSQFVENERPHTAFRENSNEEPVSYNLAVAGAASENGTLRIVVSDALSSPATNQTFEISVANGEVATSIATKVESTVRTFFNNLAYNTDNTISLVTRTSENVIIKHRNALSFTITLLETLGGFTITETSSFQAMNPIETLGYLFSPSDNLIIVMDGDSTNKTFPVPLNHKTRVAGVIGNGNFIGDGVNTTFASSDDSFFGTIISGGTAKGVGVIHNDSQLLNYYASFNGQFTGDGANGTTTIDIEAARNHIRVPSSGKVIITPDEDLGVGYCTPFDQDGGEITCKLSANGTWTFNDISGNVTVNSNTIASGASITVGTTVFPRGMGTGQWEPDSTETGETAQNIATAINQTFDTTGFSAAVRNVNEVHITADVATKLQNAMGNNSIVVTNATGIVANSTFPALTRTESPITRVARDLNRNRSTYFFGSAGTGLVLSDFTTLGFKAGDIITITGLGNEVNNGSFVIVDVGADNAGVPFVTVFDLNGVEETNSKGAAVISNKRRVTTYPAIGGNAGGDLPEGRLQFSEVFPEVPLNQGNVDASKVASDGGDVFNLIPSTLDNLNVQFNNTRLSSLSLSAEIEDVERGKRLDIASRLAGSAGLVLVSGGVGNNELGFQTTSTQGLQGYNYYTGLLQRVHNTIYGDDTDLATFPGVGAAGNRFSVLAPTITEIIVEIDITLNEGVSIAAVENGINTAVTAYINSLGVGADVIVEEIRSRIIQISGISDVAISRLTGGAIVSTTNIANISIADNEIARIKVSDITLG